MLCVLWLYHLSCSCSALGCNVRDLHMMRYGTTLGSSLGLVLVELRGSALNGLDCSVINSLGRYSMTSFALVDLVLSSELNDLGSALNGVDTSTLGFALNGSTLSLVLDGLGASALGALEQVWTKTSYHHAMPH